MSATSRVGTCLTPAVFRLSRMTRRPHVIFGQCEFVGETDATMLGVLLKVTDKGDYDWVECGSCEACWQVPHYAERVG